MLSLEKHHSYDHEWSWRQWCSQDLTVQDQDQDFKEQDQDRDWVKKLSLETKTWVGIGSGHIFVKCKHALGGTSYTSVWPTDRASTYDMIASYSNQSISQSINQSINQIYL